MPHLRISHAAELLGVSDDTVRRWIDQGQLSAENDESGRQVIEGRQLAAFAQERAQSDRPQGTSARNAFTGLVTHVVSDTVMSSVELQCGPYRVMALVSTEAVKDLGLEPGVVATARIKATNVIIEGEHE
ncbi:TOBE domain-containing protein [Propionibacteriaceae bacterium G1746]|uniref:TOBE domain-containing protein n=1 Tax=Aestuariimicrobium sp. G57 TaxID=3418485 RepID=UPI003C212B60